MVELVRENGEIIPVSVEYPWVPPTCPCCKQLGHLQTRCPNAQWLPKKTPAKSTTVTPISHTIIPILAFPNPPLDVPAVIVEHHQPPITNPSSPLPIANPPELQFSSNLSPQPSKNTSDLVPYQPLSVSHLRLPNSISHVIGLHAPRRPPSQFILISSKKSKYPKHKKNSINLGSNMDSQLTSTNNVFSCLATINPDHIGTLDPSHSPYIFPTPIQKSSSHTSPMDLDNPTQPQPIHSSESLSTHQSSTSITTTIVNTSLPSVPIHTLVNPLDSTSSLPMGKSST